MLVCIISYAYASKYKNYYPAFLKTIDVLRKHWEQLTAVSSGRVGCSQFVFFFPQKFSPPWWNGFAFNQPIVHILNPPEHRIKHDCSNLFLTQPYFVPSHTSRKTGLPANRVSRRLASATAAHPTSDVPAASARCNSCGSLFNPSATSARWAERQLWADPLVALGRAINCPVRTIFIFLFFLHYYFYFLFFVLSPWGSRGSFTFPRARARRDERAAPGRRRPGPGRRGFALSRSRSAEFLSGHDDFATSRDSRPPAGFLEVARRAEAPSRARSAGPRAASSRSGPGELLLLFLTLGLRQRARRGAPPLPGFSDRLRGRL